MKIRLFLLLLLFTGTQQVARSQEMYPVWAASIGGPGWDIARTICINDDDELLVTGAFSDTITIAGETYVPNGLTDVFAAKFSAGGEYLGAMTLGGEGAEYPMFSVYESYEVLAVKYHHPFSIQGEQVDSLDQTNYLVAWFDPDGQLLSHQVIAGKEDIKLTGMETDKQGSVYLTGWFTDTLEAGGEIVAGYPGENAFIATLKNQGKQVSVSYWEKTEAGRIYASYPEEGNKLSVAGILNTQTGKNNTQYLYYTQVKNNKLGTIDTLAKGVDIEPESVTGVDDDIWLTARYKHYYIIGEDTTYARGQNDVILAKIPGKTGETQIRHIGGYANDRPLNLSVSGEQVLMSGLYADTIWFGGDDYLVSEKWGSDLFLAVYTSDSLSPVKTISLGGISNDFPCAVATSDAGVYVLGQFKNSLELGEYKFETRGSYDVFVARFENCGAKEAVDITITTGTDSKGQTTYELTAGDGYSSYEWSDNLGYGQSVTVSGESAYTVTATDEYGCTCTGEADLSSDLKSTTLGDEQSGGDGTGGLVAFSLYPTITSDKVYWEPGSNFPGDGASLKVYDAAGRIVIAQEITGYLQPEATQTLKMDGLTPGQYLVEVTGNGYNESVKVMVK